MGIKLFRVLIFCLLVLSCSKKQFICPAYNTYFIHDQNEREQLFSPFKIDSTSDEYYGNNSTETVETKTTTVSPDVFWKDGGNIKSDKDGKSELKGEQQNDNTTVSTQTYDNPNSKYHPKDRIAAKKTPMGGLLTVISDKNKMRNVTDIEMKVVMVKPLSKYSNVDSASITGQPAFEQEPTQNVMENNRAQPDEVILEKKKGKSSRKRKQLSTEAQSDTL